MHHGSSISVGGPSQGYLFGTKYYPYYYPYGYYPWNPYGTYEGPMLVGQLSTVDPALLLPEAQPEPLNPDAAASAALSAGQYSAAVRLHRELLDDGGADGPEIQQRLILALCGDQRFVEAASLAADLLTTLPTVAAAPVSGPAFVPDALELRKLVTGAVRRAHREPSVEGWLLVALLMEMESRGETAARMVDRAAALGLDPALAGALADSMRLVGGS